VEESQIIKKCLQKDRAAEKLLYLQFVKKVFGICRRYSVDDHQAEDFMQDSFMKVFTHLRRFDVRKGNLESWILRIVINTILTEKRYQKNNRKEEYINLSDEMLPSEIETEDIDFQDIQSTELLAAIRKLPMKYRDVLNLFVFENLTHQEIAKLMSIEISSSRSRLSRAKKMLKQILSENKTTAV